MIKTRIRIKIKIKKKMIRINKRMIRIKKKKRKRLRAEKNKEDLIRIANQVNQVRVLKKRNPSKIKLLLILKKREINQVMDRLKVQNLNNSLTLRLLLKR